MMSKPIRRYCVPAWKHCTIRHKWAVCILVKMTAMVHGSPRLPHENPDRNESKPVATKSWHLPSSIVRLEILNTPPQDCWNLKQCTRHSRMGLPWSVIPKLNTRNLKQCSRPSRMGLRSVIPKLNTTHNIRTLRRMSLPALLGLSSYDTTQLCIRSTIQTNYLWSCSYSKRSTSPAARLRMASAVESASLDCCKRFLIMLRCSSNRCLIWQPIHPHPWPFHWFGQVVISYGRLFVTSEESSWSFLPTPSGPFLLWQRPLGS